MPNTKNHLFIGLGGTGGKVLRELRKRMYEGFGANEPDNGLFVDYLYVDSSVDDLNEQEGWRVLGKSVHLKTDQKLSIHGISLSMFEQLGQYPGIQAFLTANDVKLFKERLGPLVTAGIGGQRRRLGRTLIANNLAINDSSNANNFNIRLKSKVAQLTAHGTQPVTFHICAGLAGGTGSGIIIDVISQIRKEYTGDSYRIYLYLYVPEINVVNPTHDQDGLYQANGYAALLELNSLSTGRYEPLDITGEHDPYTMKVRRLRSDNPFDTAYLYTNVNTGGNILNLATSLPAAVADFIYQKSIAPGENNNAQLARLVGCENDGAGPEQDQAGIPTRSRRFISFGIKRIEYPETEVCDFVTLNYAEQAALQLQYNYWQDGLGYLERSLEEVGTGFWGEIKNVQNRDKMLLSNAHLTLSKPIISTPSTNNWMDIDSTWEKRTQGYMDEVMNEHEKKNWLSELSKQCDDYYIRYFRVLGVKKFYEIQQKEKRAYASYIRRHIENDLFEEWNAGTKSILEIEKYTRLLIKDLEDRTNAFKQQAADLSMELDGLNAAIKEDTRNWQNINWLLDGISGKSKNILAGYRNHKRDYYINLTRQEGYAYAVQLLGEIGDQLSAMLNGILAFKAKINEILEATHKQAAGKCVNTGDEMITKKYNPDIVRTFTKSVATNPDYQGHNAKTIRHRMVVELGEGDSVARSFGILSDKLSIDAASDLIYEICRVNAFDAMKEAAKTDPTLKMVGVNILEKLKEEYNTEEKLEKLVQGWKMEAQTYLPLDKKQMAMNFNNSGGSKMAMIQVAIPEMEGDPFREQLIKAIQGEFPGFKPETDVAINTKSNQIVIVTAEAGFPLRYVSNLSVLKQKFDYKIIKDGELAKMSMFGESFASPLPSLFEMTPQEIRQAITRPVLLGYALGLFVEQTNIETGARFHAISFPNQFGQEMWEPLGKNLIETLDKLSQDYSLAIRVKNKIEKTMQDYKTNEQKLSVTKELGNVLNQTILPLFGNNTFNEEYRRYEAIATDILSNELKQV